MASKHITSIVALLCGVLLTISSLLHADDTEIYIGNNGNNATVPVVFFYIEYSSNLASSVCTNVTVDNISTSCSVINPIKAYMSPNDLSSVDTTIDQFELTRAALKRVLIGLSSGVKVGLLMAHDNLANCSGGPNAADGCSQGGYILKGVTSLESPSSGFNPATATASEVKAELDLKPNKKALFQKLDAIHSPHGNFSHEHQDKEVYFELFRYLTGQKLYNAKNGWVDFGTDSTYNIGGYTQYAYKSVPSKTKVYDCSLTDPVTCYNSFNFTTATKTGTLRWVIPTNSQPNDTVYAGDFMSEDQTNNFISTLALQRDLSIEESDGVTYKPGLTTACEKVYVINVVDGKGVGNNDADTAIAATLANGGLNTTIKSGDDGFKTMLKWLYDVDLADGSFGRAGDILGTQNVTSYFIAKHPDQVDGDAQKGGTGYAIPLTDNADSVVKTINDIFRSIIDASTTFTAAAIPVNVFNRSEVLDNAYIALFQPNANSQPFWVGDIKKLKMEIYVQCNLYDTVDPTKCVQSVNRLRLVDTLKANAISDTTGRIIPQALTYWTNKDGYDLSDNLALTNGESEIAGRDGRSVHRGGAGQQIPNMLSAAATGPGTMNWTNSDTGRRLYTSPDSGTTPLAVEWSNIDSLWPSIYDTSGNTDYPVASQWPTTYSSANTTAALSSNWSTAQNLYTQNPTGTSTVVNKSYTSGTPSDINSLDYRVSDLASKVLAYMRGFDVNDGNGNSVYNESRRWIFGDPLHSRPLPLNYGARGSYSKTNPDIRLIVGSNDGYLRMLRNTNSDGTESGREEWAFMPRESMKIQKQLMDNGQDSQPDHPYGVDGPPSAYVRDRDGTIGTCSEPNAASPCDDAVLVFFGLRRGGRAYYGLNITNPDAAPTVMWRITGANSSTNPYRELGYSFGQPTIRHLKWGTYTASRPVVIIGGGYDVNKDTTNPLLGSNDTMGRAIYIIDAETGDLVWKATGNSTDSTGNHQYVAEMKDSIPSEVMALDSSGDGNVDRLYVGDTGGRVWRVDLPGSDITKWKATMLLNLGRHETANDANDRRFFYAPDVVPSSDTNGDYDAIIIGSGNREHPRQTQTTDYLYMYKDRTVAGSLPDTFTTVTPSGLADVTNNCVQDIGLTCTVPSFASGWKLKLEDRGEKMLASVLTLRGVIYFSTYVPTPPASSSTTSCNPSEGIGYQYAVALTNAVAVINYDTTNTVTDSNGKAHELQKNDRRRKLKSPGIPSESVYVSYRDSEKRTINCILASDLSCGDDIGLQQWSTYWFEKQK